jgi:aspartyl-tRNA(Asn)/glutamyl-tRNA(Gln) amidotransferase subunit C
MSELTRGDIENLSILARIEVSEEEKDALANSLGSVISYVSEISKVVTEKDPKPVAGELRNVMREDGAPRQGGGFTDAILRNAPDTEDGYFKVKRII